MVKSIKITETDKSITMENVGFTDIELIGIFELMKEQTKNNKLKSFKKQK